jgi:hypothetical protein
VKKSYGEWEEKSSYLDIQTSRIHYSWPNEGNNKKS